MKNAPPLLFEGYMTEDSQQFDPLPILISFLIPGLGQIMQNRKDVGFKHLVLWIILWCILLGWTMHIWSPCEAYGYENNKGNS